MWILLITLIYGGDYTDHVWVEASDKDECVAMGDTRVRFFKHDNSTLITYSCVEVVGK